MMTRDALLAPVLVLVLATGASSQPAPGQAGTFPTLDGRPPVVIAHRGASGLLPDHTLEAYALAIDQGADLVEPDLVSTRDGYLIARHEPNLIGTTDVRDRPVFADRRRTVTVDGNAQTGFFASDFTLAEIRTLRAVQPLAERPQEHDGKLGIPTLAEIIELVKRKSLETGRTVGIYPEIKSPTYHRQIGLPLEARLVAALEAAGWNRADAPVIVQSFEPSSLRSLNALTPVRLVQLVDATGLNPDGSLSFSGPRARPYDWTLALDPRTYADLLTPAGLAEVRTYADGVGPWKRYLVSARATDANGDGRPDDLNGDFRLDESDLSTVAPSSVVRDAHRLGLFVHAWTFRDEPRRLAADYGADPVREYRQYFELGVDGVFTDFTATAVRARDGR